MRSTERSKNTETNSPEGPSSSSKDGGSGFAPRKAADDRIDPSSPSPVRAVWIMKDGKIVDITGKVDRGAAR